MRKEIVAHHSALRVVRSAVNLTRDDRGLAVIELAVIAPVLLVMMIGMSEIATAYSARLQLEQAAQRTVEKVLNNSISSSADEPLKLEAADAAGVRPDAVSVAYTLECGNIPQPDPRTPCLPGQVQARFLKLDITKRYLPMFTTRFIGSSGDGSFMLRGHAAARIQ